ncbi:MAG: ISL3 family transposase [Actinomycetota bacterium]|nr:ISL3 family transposase [Actinomycetota bacterium]
MDAEASGLVTAALFGLDGFRVLAAADAGGELELMIETTADRVGCPACGAVATAKDRRPTWVGDLPIAGRPVVLCWVKRIWACDHQPCPKRTWTETHEAIGPRAVLTERAATAAVGQVRVGATVAGQARALGVSWHTVMRQVRHLGVPVVKDPARLDGVTAIGVDEHAWQHAGLRRRTQYATGIVDLTPGRPARLLDVVPGRSGAALRAWLAARPADWRAAITTAALDPFRGYATALGDQLPDATRVLDPFHVCKLGLTALDEVRRRVQQHTLGHRGHAQDPLYRARRLLRRRADRLDQRGWDRLRARLEDGDPNGEVTAAWAIAQDLMAAYATANPATGRAHADKVITDALSCPVPEVQRLGRTLRAWRPELLAFFDTHRAASNGPTEAVNLLIETTRRTGHGFRNFDNYRLRLLLAHGLPTCDHQRPRIRRPRPRLVA